MVALRALALLVATAEARSTAAAANSPAADAPAAHSTPPAGTAGAEAPAAQDVGRPDILLTVIDDLGWNDLGFRNKDIDSPHLDSLAHNGVVLTGEHGRLQTFPEMRAFHIDGAVFQSTRSSCGARRRAAAS